jgi:hypothetical protein
MASVLLKRVCFSIAVFVMMVFGGVLALLGILIVMLMHPRTLFRKIVRNGAFRILTELRRGLRLPGRG